MTLPEIAIKRKPIAFFVAALLLLGGIMSYLNMGWLEDPEFTIKTAVISVAYPGASAGEVEMEVVDRIETKLQEMEEIDNISSISRPGLAIIKVDIKEKYWFYRLPQIWDVMRKKIRDVEATLPPGAAMPQIKDDFGYVFGFLLAISGEGFSAAELERCAKNLRKELKLVNGVARVDLWGVREKRIYLEAAESQLTQLGITKEDLLQTLQLQNKVVDAGNLDIGSNRLRIAPTGAFQAPDDIRNIVFSPGRLNPQGKDELIRLGDIATVRSGYADPPRNMMRFNGRPALMLALAPVDGTNVVEVGQTIDSSLKEISAKLPAGIEVTKFAWQTDRVEESIHGFLINLGESVLIVLLVLTISMGWRAGLIVGASGLVLAILGTFIVMWTVEINLHRISLGALIVAMGMMVDNAIVVVDGFVVRREQSMERSRAAIESASIPAWALLGATVAACMAFFPIFFSKTSAGEYAGGLFSVIGISLLLSWLLSQTITPLMCMALLPDPKKTNAGADVYGGRFNHLFRAILYKAIRFRVLFLGGMVLLFIASIGGFGQVPIMFFPDSSRQQVMIDFWEPEGTTIQKTSTDLKGVESRLLKLPQVKNISSFIGEGPPRFYLPVSPEQPYSSYAQIIVNIKTLKGVGDVMKDIEPWLEENYPHTLTRVRRYGVGPSDDWKFEARFSGPAEADPAILRSLAQKGMAILEASPYAKEVRTNWRHVVKKIVPVYDQKKGRWTGVSRQDLADTTKRAFDGLVVGQFREGDDLIPLVLRYREDERRAVADHLGQLQVTPSLSTESVPLAQVTKDVHVAWEDPIIWRWDRRRAITVQCSPKGVTLPTLRDSVLADFNKIELPPGYKLEWDGEYDSSKRAANGLLPGVVPATVTMALVIVMLFNAFRPPIIITLTIPFAFIGITSGMLLTGQPFGFMAILGAMSLSGMMIKNAVVLLDQVDINLKGGMKPYPAVMEAAVARLRPVLNAAATTVFGMAPLLQDVFWVSMAVTIMFGLAFGTILTMMVVPVLYTFLFRIKVYRTG
ncbi:multidrug transporter AcrB [Desulfosarcina widdelii]|uniref:Multidrug transporter AcrB n=1 Tax=Desulfosarcina widdelii TaxID=947919 RepID=A0A5K7YWS2_9BACT|nr:efflux RND transporter permease subunit [Desulfosarcina widdelii]BBO73068.1 multidrug transporter AcrB [Desulfosarcina widdelii]